MLSWNSGDKDGKTVVSARPQQPTAFPHMSFDAFLARADEDTWAEWVAGKVVILLPASMRQPLLKKFLVTALGLFVQRHGLGVVLDAPFRMKFGGRGSKPDLLLVAREHLRRLREAYRDGPADLVGEILSPESAARDRGEKFYEHEAAGVREYWLMDPEREWAEFYRQDERGRFRPAFVGREGEYRTDLLSGFRLRIEWFRQESLPPVPDARRDFGVL